MEAQSVVVIHDASREINPNVFKWALHGLSLIKGDILTLVAVLHQVITPMGYKGSVDSRSMMGANQKIVDAYAARKKEEYLNNKELVDIFKLYKSKKVVFKIEVATGSSPKAVALKSAKNLMATWVILDRKMKNDEEYFLQKLSCGILRIRRFNRIIRLREPVNYNLPKEIITPGDSSSHEINHSDFTPLLDISTELDLFSIEISPHSKAKYYQMNQEKGQGHDDEAEYSSEEEVGINQMREKNPDQLDTENNKCYRNCGGSNRETQEQKSLNIQVNQKSERCLSFGGARNYFLGGAEEYVACKQFFSFD